MKTLVGRPLCIYSNAPSMTSKFYEDQGQTALLPHRIIREHIIEAQWDEILRFIATIRLKVATASQLFKRLNSYSRQHPLYQALKEFGKLPKSLFSAWWYCSRGVLCGMWCKM